MRIRIVLFALLLPALAGSASARTFVEATLIRESLEAAWSEVAPEGASMEILRVPNLAYVGEDPRVEVSMLEGMAHPGPRALSVSCRVDGRVVSRGLANVVVRVRRSIWTTPDPLKRGAMLDESKLVSSERQFDREPRRLFEPVEGRRWRVARDIEAGTLLCAAHVRALPDVEAGSEIVLVARSGQASVTVVGRARRDGNVGDTILVHNPITGTLVNAVILDRNTALLATPKRRQAN